jgi:TolC family type I secretion outer membrane protein
MGCVGAALMLALVAPGAAWSMTIDEALSLAYNNNPTLLSQRAALRATDELVPQALSNYRPTITGSASYGRQWVNSQNNALTGNGTAASNPGTAGVTLQQPLFRGGRTIAQTQQAENTVLAARAQLLTAEQTVLFNAATAYLNVLRDQAVVDLNINNEQVLRRQLQATRDRFNVGEVTRTDVSQAEASLSTATAGRVAAEGTLAASRANFVNVIGVMPENITFPTKPLDLPKSVQEATNIAAERNPNVIAALYNERAARYGVDLVEGELLPTLSLNGTFARQVDQLSAASAGTLNRDNSANAASITAQLSVPLYEAGSVTSRVRAAKQTVSQRRQDVLTQRRSAIENATRAYNNLLSTRAQIVSFQAAVRANTIALDGVRQENLAGLRTVLDVLDAEQALLGSRVSLVSAQRDATLAQYDVRQAVGLLTAADLKLQVDTYNVENHYNDVRNKIWGLGDPVEKPQQ